ncbi:unnamed protein product [Parnassius apollo]|uniref:(apollo) hypothetical protein n=1 Tax=Parnassius apollo TaxID=110799 RepID=A0A8S3Y4H3_PARAO|nr:unnamed protein product [Parnassius apollo]
MGIGEIVLSEPCGRDEALGVGDTPGELGCTFTTLSLELRFGDNLEGKLSVFVHCDRLRTILSVHMHKTRSLNTSTRTRTIDPNRATVGGRMRCARRSKQNLTQAVQVATWFGLVMSYCTCVRGFWLSFMCTATDGCWGPAGYGTGPIFCLSMGRPPQLRR